jgi:hypothetical protein
MSRYALAVTLLLFACTKRAPTATPPAAPSFVHDIAPVLDRMCARAEGCHGTKPTDSVDLDLRAAAAYRQLVEVPAQARKGASRVKRGDPAASFLVEKLTGHLGPREGKPMPIDPNTGVPVVPSPIPSDYVEHILMPWIAAGAPDS